MKKLCELVMIEENNENCVVLKTKKEERLELIKLGCFNGKEDMIIMTKGEDQTITIIEDSKNNYSWNKHTLVVDNMSKKRFLINQCITQDMDIYCGENKNLILKSMKNLSNPMIEHTIKFMLSHGICTHKDNEFYSYFETLDEAKLHFVHLGYNLDYEKKEIAQTGIEVLYFKISKPNNLKKYYLSELKKDKINDNKKSNPFYNGKSSNKNIKGFMDLYNSENGKALHEIATDAISKTERLCFGVYDTSCGRDWFPNLSGEFIIYIRNGVPELVIEGEVCLHYDYFADDIKVLLNKINVFNKKHIKEKDITLEEIKEILLSLGYTDLTQY